MTKIFVGRNVRVKKARMQTIVRVSVVLCMRLTKTYIFYFILEICRNHDHDKRPNDGNDADIDRTLIKIPWKSGSYQNVNEVDDSRVDEDACWEDCTGKGADADYCEGERRV